MKFHDGRAFAVFGVVFGAGLGFGPIVGGAIVAVSSRQWVFLVHAPLAAPAFGARRHAPLAACGHST